MGGLLELLWSFEAAMIRVAFWGVGVDGVSASGVVGSELDWVGGVGVQGLELDGVEVFEVEPWAFWGDEDLSGVSSDWVKGALLCGVRC